MNAEQERGRYEHHFTVVGIVGKNGMPQFWIEDNLNIEGSVYDRTERVWFNRERVWITDDRLYNALANLLAKATDNG
jgi:hypothetical protein